MYFGTLDYATVFENARAGTLADNTIEIFPGQRCRAHRDLLFCSRRDGQVAQFRWTLWLPDSMEGRRRSRR